MAFIDMDKTMTEFSMTKSGSKLLSKLIVKRHLFP